MTTLRPGALPALVALAGAALAAPGSALAQGAGTGTDRSVDVQTFWPVAGPSETLGVRGSTIQPSGGVGFALVANLERLPLVLTEPMSGMQRAAVDTTATTDFLWSIGILDRLQVNLAVPLVVAQTGEGATPILGGSNGALGDTALRDLRFDVAIALARRARTADATGFGLRLDLGGAAPFGDDKAFQSSGGWTFQPVAVADLRTRYLTFTVNLGARILSQTSQIANLTVGSHLTYGGAVSFHPRADSRFNGVAEVFGTLPVVTREGAPSRGTNELFLGARYATDAAHDIELFAGAGLPLGQSPLVPAWRALVGISYAPRGNDSDHDGVVDAEDRCLAVAEDRDEYEDDDGCPDPDNDGDTVPDATDRCRDQPEDADNFEDDDGCPDDDNDGDGVNDPDDQCTDVAQGEHPDPERGGCPIPDSDHDGVLDPDDRCMDTAQGPRPDPTRAGCPIPDRDQDGVADADDRCPDEARGAHPDRFRAGCADPDLDRDGFPNATDRCPDEPETVNGVTDDDGCADTGPELVTWDAANTDALRFARPAVVPARVQALPLPLVALLQQSALRIRGRGSEVLRVIVEVEPGPGAPGTTEAARQAGLVGDVLLARGIAQRSLTTRAAARPTGPATPGVPRPALVPGRVRIRVLTPTSPAEPAPAAAPAPPAPAPRPAAPAAARPAAARPVGAARPATPPPATRP
ncbi:MAG: hypothetical protein HY909_15090 [Deltaproteobacteria bacterium]|nr:hypothetical protein [Deltaproteobacteria bacterium]